MSWYYSYFICRIDKEDGKLYPFGPFDYKGRFFPVLEKSRSCASTLYEEFSNIQTPDARQLISEDLLKAVHDGLSDDEYKDFYEGDGSYCWSYLPYKELPSGTGEKKGFCLIEDIECYEDKDRYFEDFYDWLTPEIYARKLENELKFGPPKPVKDEFGDEYTPHSMRDYSFYRWIDHESPEYEASVIREAYETMRRYGCEKEDGEIIVLLVQG